MSLTAQNLWHRYREGVGGTNHDGSFTLPETVEMLGPRQYRGWCEAVSLANQHASDVNARVAEKVVENRDLQMEVRVLRTKLNSRDAELLAARQVIAEFDRVRALFTEHVEGDA